MELYKEILIHILSNEAINISFPTLSVNVSEIIEGECYKALQRIKEILGEGALNDAECFERIEEIVYVFEQIGSTGDSRHDFG